jgi:hypothetical protein
MARAQRETILVKGKVKKTVASEYAAAKLLGVSVTAVQQAKRWGTEVKGWRAFDTPEKLLERIAELEGQIKFLKEND